MGYKQSPTDSGEVHWAWEDEASSRNRARGSITRDLERYSLKRYLSLGPTFSFRRVVMELLTPKYVPTGPLASDIIKVDVKAAISEDSWPSELLIRVFISKA
jgi:hypothetical protein